MSGSSDAASEVTEVRRLLKGWGAGFANACRLSGTHERDPGRSGEVAIGSRGLEADECRAFLRAYESGLVTVDTDGRFWMPEAGVCSTNLHLIGRSGDAVALHTEYLIQIGAYGELVLDLGWDPADLAFEMGEFDTLGMADGRVVLAVEAKARVDGPDSLNALRKSFLALQDDPTVTVTGNHRRKWDELVKMAAAGPVELAMVTSGARWAWEAVRAGDGLRLTEVSGALSW